MNCSVCSQPAGDSIYVVGRVSTALCAECIEGAEGALTGWMAERMRQLACADRAEERLERRTTHGRARLPIALRIIARDGYVTPDSFGKAAKLPRQSSYNALRYLMKRGFLECDVFYGGEVRYFVAEALQPRRAEAAE